MNPHKDLRRKQGGFVTIEFVCGIAFLLLPVTLLVLILPTWTERQSVARVVARETARTYVTTGNLEQARQAGFLIADNDKIPRTDVTIDLTGDPAARGTSVRAIVRMNVPETSVPLLGGNDGFEFTETHAEVVDLYRSAR